MNSLYNKDLNLHHNSNINLEKKILFILNHLIFKDLLENNLMSNLQ